MTVIHDIRVTQSATDQCEDIALYVDHKEIGHAILNWVPKYALYKTCDIPEIQDVHINQDHRKKGYATALINFCEDRVRDKGKENIGISVPVVKDFAPAQCLYISLGYKPDGYGVTYDRQTVGFGDIRPVDDNLCLMMIKRL